LLLPIIAEYVTSNNLKALAACYIRILGFNSSFGCDAISIFANFDITIKFFNNTVLRLLSPKINAER
jgi:hypothetical protein